MDLEEVVEEDLERWGITNRAEETLGRSSVKGATGVFGVSGTAVIVSLLLIDPTLEVPVNRFCNPLRMFCNRVGSEDVGGFEDEYWKGGMAASLLSSAVQI